MVPTGVITGRVTDEGRPAGNVWVRAMRVTYLDGVRTFMSGDSTPTDDLGEYRLFGLAPGEARRRAQIDVGGIEIQLAGGAVVRTSEAVLAAEEEDGDLRETVQRLEALVMAQPDQLRQHSDQLREQSDQIRQQSDQLRQQSEDIRQLKARLNGSA
jgi:hypothetical protein